MANNLSIQNVEDLCSKGPTKFAKFVLGKLSLKQFLSFEYNAVTKTSSLWTTSWTSMDICICTIVRGWIKGTGSSPYVIVSAIEYKYALTTVFMVFMLLC